MSQLRPRASQGWLIFAVAAGAMMAPALASALGWLAHSSFELGDDNGIVFVAGPLAVLALIGVAVIPRSSVPRLLRASLATATSMAIMAFVAWGIWNSDGNRWAALVELPLEATFSWTLGAVALVALAATVHQSVRSRRRMPQWLRPVVVFSIANLFTFGLWLPLLAALWPEAFQHWNKAITSGPAALFTAIAPPAVVALYVTVLRPQTLARHGVALGVVMATAVLAGISVRGDVDPIAEQVYAEFTPLMISFGFLALGLIVLLAISQWRELAYHRRDASEPAPWVQHGTVIGHRDEPVGTWVGTVTFYGWLVGFVSRLDSFRVRTTDNHIIDVPRRSHLSMPLGRASVNAVSGEVVSALCVGDPVAVAGYVAPPADGAYRQTSTPIASTDGVIAYGPGRHHVFASVAYLLWRPCALFLVATSAIAIPGLIGLPF